MLRFTKFKDPCSKILLPFHRALQGMTDFPVRPAFKRVAHERADSNYMKLKKLRNDDTAFPTESKELRLQILGNGAHGCPASVVICSNSRSYLFNCGEGTQRLCMEYRVRLPRITNIFFTSSTWENVGGLPGYILTAQGQGLPNLILHGAKNVGELLDSTQSFIKVDYMDIIPHEKDYFEDGTLRVKQVKLKSTQSTTDNEQDVFAYICKGYEKPGMLLLTKCAELGVPPGPLFSKLKAGFDITLENGKVVKPSDVLAASLPGLVVIILECPSEEYVDSLLASKEIAQYQNLPGNDAALHVRCVVHMTPDAVYKSEKYQTFLGRFAETTRHLHLHGLNTTAVSTGAYRRVTRLNLVNDEIFPMLAMSETDDVPPMTTLSLRDNRITIDDKYETSVEKFVKEVREFENFDTVRAELEKRLASAPCLDTREWPKLTFLGTGSSLPTKDRNVSAILVQPTENTAFLLDCGEGTWNQLVRSLGIEKADEIVSQLKFIYVSHIHADHHLGLATLLLRRKTIGITDKLTVIAPSFLPSWLNVFSTAFTNLACDFRNCRSFMKYEVPPEAYSSRLAVKCITTCFVDHCPEAFGVRIDLDNYSLVYSGDTQPCENLVKLGLNCDLLIHEATMEDDLIRDAKIKAHSTTAQAMEIGKNMNAKFTLLTHFSQRYSKLPMIDENYFADGKLGLAFDYMRVSPKKLHILPLLYPMLKCVFADHYGQLKGRTQKYVKKAALFN